jgi:hypothetical protein
MATHTCDTASRERSSSAGRRISCRWVGVQLVVYKIVKVPTPIH